MDDIKKEQIISAIYIAIEQRKYRCALTIFDDTTMQMMNESLDKVIELAEKYSGEQLNDKIRQLKHDI